MNFFKYLESRFVTSQLAINNKQIANATSGVAVNKAFRGWMWFCLQVMTVLHFFFVPFHFLAVLFRILPAPRTAAQLIAEEQSKQKAMEELSKKVQQDLLSGAMKERAETGLDSVPRKGSA